MEYPIKKLLTVTLIFILVISSLAILDTAQNPVISPVNNSDNKNSTSQTIMAYVPTGLKSYVGNQLNSTGIPYSYYGNLLNVNDSTQKGTISYVFSELNRTLGITYFTFNNSNDFIPYIQNPSYQARPYLPSNIYNAYDINYTHNEGYYGNNTTIVIVDAYGDPTLNYDVSVFDNKTGLPPINLTVTTPEGAITSTNSQWASETAIDVEWAHAIAPGAKIDLVLSPGSGSRLLDSVAYAVTHKLGNIISISWGEAESDLSPHTLTSLNNIYEQAAANNITVVAASGDQGANDGTSHLAVNFPASDPYVLGVGGTTLNQISSGQYTQTAWGDIVNGKEEGSGGGFSSYFTTPYYQVAPNYTESYRGVPDVALDANPNTGVLVVVDGATSVLGGTSISTPMWAGIIAIMDQYYGKSLGLVNPLFYKISETKYYKNAFTPITSGSNAGYSAGPGWNPVTGLGTPKVSNLINDTGKIMNGYGTVAVFNNTSYATDISASINVPGNNVEQFNGSTYYYLGFYENQTNYIKFGISTNSTGYYYKYSIYENGTETRGILPGAPSAYIGIKISGAEIYFTVNNSTVKELNVPVSFSGDYHAVAGAQQDNAKINFVNISKATYSNIDITNATGRINYTGIYTSGYSNMGTDYSNITFSYNSSAKSLTAYMGKEVNKQIYGKAGAVHILYSITFGKNSTLKFSLSNGNSATYAVNGSTKFNPVSLSGGYYNISATESSGVTFYREIHVPTIRVVSVTISSNPSYYSPQYTLIVDHYFGYTSSSKTIDVYELSGNNNATINSTGYFTANASASTIGFLTLKPEKVLVDVFVSNGNATVTLNGVKTNSIGGYHFLYVTPDTTYINATDTGYTSQNQSMNLTPGQNIHISLVLSPKNSSFKAVQGTVENVQYGYGLSNVNITSDGKTIGYTNSSGQFVLFLNGTTNATFHEYLYVNNTTSISPGSSPVVYMSPASVSVLVINFKITYSLPLGFYYAFVSWDKYPSTNFAEYVVAYSNNSLMLNPHTEVISSRGTNFGFIPGLTPGKTYYVIVDAYTPSGSFVSSNEVAVHYTIISYLITLLIFAGIVAYIVFIILFFIQRKKRKKMNEEEYDYFQY